MDIEYIDIPLKEETKEVLLNVMKTNIMKVDTGLCIAIKEDLYLKIRKGKSNRVYISIGTVVEDKIHEWNLQQIDPGYMYKQLQNEVKELKKNNNAKKNTPSK